MVIGALLVLDGRMQLEELDQLVRDKLLSLRRFQQHVVEPPRGWGRPRWQQDAPFDLRRHVAKLDVAGPLEESALVTLVGERMSTPLPSGSSPWRFELVDFGARQSAILVRVHHSIADGLALISVLQDLADERPAKASADQSPTALRARGNPLRRILGEVGGLFRFLTLFADVTTSLKNPLGGTKRVAWSGPIPLESIKAIARVRGHRLIDVLLGAVAGALGRHLRLRGPVPRQVRGLLPIAAAPGSSSVRGLGNHYASVFVRLPVDDGDAVARTENVARQLTRLRSRGEPAVAGALVTLAGTVWPRLERRAVGWWSRRASLVVSSLAGPKEDLRLAGRRLESMMVWAPAPASIGLSLTLFGYAGALRLGILADTAVIDRPHELVADFEAALAEIGAGAVPPSA